MENVLTTTFVTGLLASSFSLAIPLLLATLGEVFVERSGLLNMGIEPVVLPKGERVAQGIFYNYLTADGDEKVTKAVRGGGFGSTGK